MARNEVEESYLTVADVAATLKLNQQTVRNWIDAGTLPALRVGRRVRIKRSDFQRILDESYSGGGGGSRTGSGIVDVTADDFWGGEPVGRAEPGRRASDAASRDAPIGLPEAAPLGTLNDAPAATLNAASAAGTPDDAPVGTLTDAPDTGGARR